MLATSPTELTTGITDALLCLECLALAAWVGRTTTREAWRKNVWAWVFVLLAFSAGLGAVAHGFELSSSTRAAIWKPLYLSLGVLVALFFVGAVGDWRGESFGRRLLPWAAAVGIGFFVVTQVKRGSFIVFVGYEAAALLGALGVYSFLAFAGRLRGAGVVAVGIVLNLVAAGIQASPASVRVVVPLDHNGLFHLVQMMAIAVLAVGLRQGMQPVLSALQQNDSRTEAEVLTEVR